MRAGDKLDSYKVMAEALGALREPSWSLLVVGDGPARDDVRGAFAALGPRVVFAGQVEETELPPLYAACDLYVWPAVNEAFGMAILEAQAAGLPVIAGDSGGVGEIVADGRTGRLVKPRDAAELADALKPLLADRGMLSTWSRNALLKVAAEHDLPVASRALDAVLTAALRVGAYA
jgi:glycosyltransferase involved in cell wall biosynthesis